MRMTAVADLLSAIELAWDFQEVTMTTFNGSARQAPFGALAAAIIFSAMISQTSAQPHQHGTTTDHSQHSAAEHAKHMAREKAQKKKKPVKKKGREGHSRHETTPSA